MMRGVVFALAMLSGSDAQAPVRLLSSSAGSDLAWSLPGKGSVHNVVMEDSTGKLLIFSNNGLISGSSTTAAIARLSFDGTAPALTADDPIALPCEGSEKWGGVRAATAAAADARRQASSTCDCDDALKLCNDSGGCHVVDGGADCNDGGGPTDGLCADTCEPCGGADDDDDSAAADDGDDDDVGDDDGAAASYWVSCGAGNGAALTGNPAALFTYSANGASTPYGSLDGASSGDAT